MDVLVTGATGFIGQHVIPQLLARGHTVTATAQNYARARTFTWFNRVHFVTYNVHNRLSDATEVFGPSDAIMHLAWSRLPNYTASFHFDENLPADCRFLKSLIDAGSEHLLVTGTCLEYGLQEGCLEESIATVPVNPYAVAKDRLHKYLQSLQERRPFVLQWARLFYMYGPGQNPDSLLASLDRAIDAGERAFNMSRGDQLRDYLPVEEVAHRLVHLIEHSDCRGPVNICSGEPISVRQLVADHLLKRGATIHLNLGYYDYPDYEPRAFWGDGSKYSRCCSDA